MTAPWLSVWKPSTSFGMRGLTCHPCNKLVLSLSCLLRLSQASQEGYQAPWNLRTTRAELLGLDVTRSRTANNTQWTFDEQNSAVWIVKHLQESTLEGNLQLLLQFLLHAFTA